MSKRRFHHLSLSEHIRLHEQILQAFTHALDLLCYQSRTAAEISAQLDFHILMPHLFPAAGYGSKPILPNIKDVGAARP